MKTSEKNAGFTLIEFIVILGIIMIMTAALTPLVLKYIEDARIARAQSEARSIADTIAALYKDTGYWPYTDKNGPTANPGIDRVLSDPDRVATGTGTGAGTGAARWGNFGRTKPLYDYLFYNNPDDDTNATNANQPGQDYPTTGLNRWKGPYIEKPVFTDPWNSSYVIDVRYLPGNPRYHGSAIHRVFVLSPGPDKKWETPFDNHTGTPDDEIRGDDIGALVTLTR